MFLRALAERLVVFQDNKIEVFEGDYESFLKQVGWSEERLEKETKTRPPERSLESISESDRDYGQPAEEAVNPVAAPDEPPFRFKLSPRELRKLRSEVIIEKSRSLKPLEERVHQLENSIEETEQRISQLTQQIIEASVAGLGQEVVRLSRELDLNRHSLESLYEEYTQVYQEYEDKRQIFERRLEELDKISS
jgi:ATP-binding cassette subfamily F protein 3